MALISDSMDIDPPDLSALSIQEGDDSNEDDGSSDFIGADTSSAITILENGRTYANSTYPIPNDATEATRLSIEHQAFTLLLDRKLTLTYLVSHRPLRILDIGCGPGDWALATATKHSNTSVVAIDFSGGIGSATNGGEIPSNLQFQLDDIRNVPWTFEDQSFDFAHMRGLAGAFTEEELRQIYSEVYRCLKPEGQFEIVDFGAITMAGSPFPATSSSSSSADTETALTTYNTGVQAALTHCGLMGLLDLSHVRPDLLERSDFRIQKRFIPAVPLGEWSSNHREHRTGRMTAVAMLEGMESRALRLLTKAMSWSKENVDTLIEKAKGEILRPGARASVQAQVITVRKFGIT